MSTDYVRSLQDKNLRRKKQDPCFVEKELSSECLIEHNASKTICESHITNYKLCKDFWTNLKIYRRRNNIYPPLPPPEEREKVKAEFFEQVRAAASRSH